MSSSPLSPADIKEPRWEREEKMTQAARYLENHMSLVDHPCACHMPAQPPNLVNLAK